MDDGDKEFLEVEPGDDIATGNAYTFAKELAESYADLLKQKEAYQNKLGTYPHYTLDDAYYLLTQGSHEQLERVQTSGTSDPVARAVSSGEKLMNRLNQEMDTEFQAEVMEPYLNICEKIRLVDICMGMLDHRQRNIAEQLYIQRKPEKYVVDIYGVHVPRKRLKKEIEAILNRFAEILEGIQRTETQK